MTPFVVTFKNNQKWNKKAIIHPDWVKMIIENNDGTADVQIGDEEWITTIEPFEVVKGLYVESMFSGNASEEE